MRPSCSEYGQGTDTEEDAERPPLQRNKNWDNRHVRLCPCSIALMTSEYLQELDVGQTQKCKQRKCESQI